MLLFLSRCPQTVEIPFCKQFKDIRNAQLNAEEPDDIQATIYPKYYAVLTVYTILCTQQPPLHPCWPHFENKLYVTTALKEYQNVG